jgi:uncharacterized repeat protein (TIGR01451 family)
MWRFAVAVVALAGTLAVLAAAGRAADPNVSATAVGQPSPFVTAGLGATYTFTLDHPGTGTLTNTTFTSQLPAGAVFQSATPSRGSCPAPVAGKVTCNLGNIPGNTLGVTVEVEFLAPAVTSMTMCGSASFKEGGSDGDSSHADTTPPACAAWTVGSANDPNNRGACLNAGSSLSTGSDATASDPQNTSVTVGDDACVTIREFAASNPSQDCGAGFKCSTQVSEVLSPPCPETEPCQVSITFDKAFGKVRRLFWDSQLVESCTSPGVADPDPCLVSRTQLKGGDTRFVVAYLVDARLRGG